MGAAASPKLKGALWRGQQRLLDNPGRVLAVTSFPQATGSVLQKLASSMPFPRSPVSRICHLPAPASILVYES